MAATKKRKRKQISKDEDEEQEYAHKLIEDFEHEEELKPFY